MSDGGLRPSGPDGAGGPAHLLTCFHGPDAGKRVLLADGALRLGSSTESEILSDDPDVASGHATLIVHAGTVSVQPIDGAALFLDGIRLGATTTIVAGQQLRAGRSLWRIEHQHDARLADFIRGLGDRISVAAGVERIQGFNAREMFSEVFKKRPDEEIEEYFAGGTARTTPPLAQVDANWPRPWAFARTFLLSLGAYLLLRFGWDQFQNPYFLPGIIALGSVAIPFAVLVFFFEMNVPRNVSVILLLKMVVFGGIFSLVVSLFFFRFAGSLSWMGAMRAGIVEETGKLAVVLFFARQSRFPWLLNGMLIGAAVGTGFSVFETAGYVMINGLLESGAGVAGMFDMINYRGPVSVLADHSLWTALVAAALWRVRGSAPFRIEMLSDPRFLRVLVLAMMLHMVNNAPINPPYNLKFAVIGFVAWVALLGFIQEGLKEVRREQIARITGERPRPA
jgi:RsiW-degrading membrane proteinase PrsW (M82 family)